MKIGTFKSLADYAVGKPVLFQTQLPDSGHILDSAIVFGHKQAELNLTVVYDAGDKMVTHTLIALCVGWEHDDVREYEFVGKTHTKKFTSTIQPMYLFTAPRIDKD